MAKRLTEYDSHGDLYVKNHDYISASYKLAHYEDLEEQGRLIELPCVPNETVWCADEYNTRPVLYGSKSSILYDIECDKGIGYTKEVAERNRKQYKNCPSDRTDISHQTCEECAEEHEQLATWLADSCAIPLLAGMFADADSEICRNIFEKGEK